MTAIYQTKGHLTDAIPDDGISKAQAYLVEDDMTAYATDPQWGISWAKGVLVLLEWKLDGNGYDYTVRATTTRELNEAEQKELSEYVSGQNSDGLGEGFEQQDFAWVSEDCDECGYNGGWGCQCGQGHMCSFDWQENELPWTRIA